MTKYQDVVLKITFCVVLIFATSNSMLLAQPSGLSPAGAPPQSNASKTVIVNISKGRQIEGELVDLERISVTTGFGEANFNTFEMEGIKLKANNDGACVFAFKNGDLVTGKIDLENLKIKTDWGEANIKIDSVEMIRINPNGEFYEDTTVEGKQRWRFGVTREVPAGNSRQNVSPQPPQPVDSLRGGQTR